MEFHRFFKFNHKTYYKVIHRSKKKKRNRSVVLKVEYVVYET